MSNFAYVKIGSRPLSEQEANILLPSYNLVIQQIENFRNTASDFNRSKSEFKGNGLETNFTNTISILGDRGSGKTSILLTIKKYLERKKIYITVPMIIPEYMGKPHDTMGWVLSYLEELTELVKLEGKKRAFDEGECVTYNSLKKEKQNSLEETFKELKQTYFFRKQNYTDFITNKNEGTADFLHDNQLSLRSDQLLISKFKNFISLLVEKKRELSQDVCEEPLIIMFFDDVDISAERCGEVLDVIRMYLNHQNIVVFVSGDYNVFLESLTLEFLRREKIPERHYDKVFSSLTREDALYGNTNQDSLIEIRKKLSQEYLKKVLPPSFRYNMKALSNQEKMDFCYYTEENNSDSISPTLSQLMKRLILTGDMNTDILQEYHFDILDKNPRSLINLYYFLNNLIITDEQDKKVENLNGFLRLLISSSDYLSEYKREIYKYISIENQLVDFNYLENIADFHLQSVKVSPISQLNSEHVFKDLIKLFVLGDLIESIIYGSKRDNSIYLANMLNKFNRYLFPKYSNSTEFLYDFAIELSNNLIFKDIENLFLEKSEQNYFAESLYFDILFKCYEKNKYKLQNESEVFLDIYFNDEQWVKHKLQFAFKISKNQNYLITESIEQVKEQISRMMADNLTVIEDSFDVIKKEYLNNKDIEVNIAKKLIQTTNEVNSYLTKRNDEIVKKYKEKERLIHEQKILYERRARLREEKNHYENSYKWITSVKSQNDKVRINSLIKEKIESLAKYINLNNEEYNILINKKIISEYADTLEIALLLNDNAGILVSYDEVSENINKSLKELNIPIGKENLNKTSLIINSKEINSDKKEIIKQHYINKRLYEYLQQQYILGLDNQINSYNYLVNSFKKTNQSIDELNSKLENINYILKSEPEEDIKNNKYYFGVFLTTEIYSNLKSLFVNETPNINIEMVINNVSVLKSLLEDIYEYFGEFNIKELVKLNIQIINKLKELNEQVGMDSFYGRFINELSLSKVCDANKYFEFIKSLRKSIINNHVYNFGYTQDNWDILDNPPIKKIGGKAIILRGNQQEKDIIIDEFKLLINLTLLIKLNEIKKNKSLNYFYELNNSLMHFKYNNNYSINNYTINKFKKEIIRIHGDKNASF